MPELRITREYIEAAMRHPSVREKLAERADAVAARARQLSAAAGRDSGAISRASGTRPKGRPYERVLSEDVAAEHGTAETSRYRILGQAAQG